MMMRSNPFASVRFIYGRIKFAMRTSLRAKITNFHICDYLPRRCVPRHSLETTIVENSLFLIHLIHSNFSFSAHFPLFTFISTNKKPFFRHISKAKFFRFSFCQNQIKSHLCSTISFSSVFVVFFSFDWNLFTFPTFSTSSISFGWKFISRNDSNWNEEMENCDNGNDRPTKNRFNFKKTTAFICIYRRTIDWIKKWCEVSAVCAVRVVWNKIHSFHDGLFNFIEFVGKFFSLVAVFLLSYAVIPSSMLWIG